MSGPARPTEPDLAGESRRRRRSTGALLAAGMLLVGGAAAGADPEAPGALEVPGGIAALVEALDLEGAEVGPTRLMPALIRLLHAAPEGARPSMDARRRRLSAYLQQLDPRDAQRVDYVPLPLGSRFWSDTILRHAVEPAHLFDAILANRRAALLYHGLSALSHPTLDFLGEHPAMLVDQTAPLASIFAAFGRSIRIEAGAVVPPGGAAAQPLWEALVGVSTAAPQPFVDALLRRDRGRLAYFYDTLAHLDAPRLRFALGVATSRDPVTRLAGFTALYDVFLRAHAEAEWTYDAQPFAHPMVDPAVVLMSVQVTREGLLAPPASRPLWAQALPIADASAAAATRPAPSSAEGDAPIDAAELLERICLAGASAWRRRLEIVLFSQRVFGRAARPDLEQVGSVLRRFDDFPTLLLTLERLDVAAPALYAAAVDWGEALSAIPSLERRRVALTLFQGALAIVERARYADSLSTDASQALVRSLLGVEREPVGLDVRLAAWTTEVLIPALGEALGECCPASAERTVLAALAGWRRPDDPGIDPEPVEWEGFSYRVDVGAGRLELLRRVRRQQRGLTLDLVTAWRDAVAALKPRLDRPSAIEVALDDLGALVEGLAPIDVGGIRAHRGTLDTERVARQLLDRLATARGDARSVVASLDELGVAMLADAVRSIVYATGFADPTSRALRGGNVAARHDFGLRLGSSRQRRTTPWRLPTIETGTSTSLPWHVSGALLALDMGLARFALRPLAEDLPRPAPRLNANDRRGFARTVASLNPFRLTDQGRDALVAALERGRQRVDELRRDAAQLDRIAQDAALDEWRQAGLAWLVARSRTVPAGFFTLSELFWLGRERASAAAGRHLDAWGTATLSLDGCLCARVPEPGRWSDRAGRRPIGALAARVFDLNLRVAELLAQMRLPAALARGVLAGATVELVNEVTPLHRDDWVGIARQAARLSPARAADYVAALATAGPLVPHPSLEDRPW